MTTDRAKRYKANREIQDDPKSGCLFCGSHRNLTVDHLSGDESDSTPANLAWLCKSCNTRKGAAFKKAGIGRRTVQYNPDLGLSPQERRNFSQLGFDFPPRADYDQARAADKKRRQQDHAAKIRARRDERKAEARERAAERKREMQGLRSRLSEITAAERRAKASGDKDLARDLREEANVIYGDLGAYARHHSLNPAGVIRSPHQWREAVAASVGAASYMSTRSAARRILSTSPAMRRKFAAAARPNPGKIPSYSQYAFAVMGYDHGRGDPALGEIIHRVPPARRSEYARIIAGKKREHGTERMTGRFRESVPF